MVVTGTHDRDDILQVIWSVGDRGGYLFGVG